MVRDPFDHRDSRRFKPRHLGRIVGQQPHRIDPEAAQHCRGETIVALVIGETEAAVGIDRVEPAVLQLIGAQFVGQPDAAALLAQVKQHPAASLADQL